MHSGGNSRAECTIRDLSDGGARLQVSPSVLLPEHFDLHVAQRGLIVRATIVWRLDKEIGVHFETDAPMAVSAVPAENQAGTTLQRRVDTLEAEVATLRKQLSAMRRIVNSLHSERA